MAADQGSTHGAAGSTPPAEQIEIGLSELDAASLQHAAATLRWFLTKVAHGWSHAALDPEQCADSVERLEAIYYEAGEQLKTAEFATLNLTNGDAALLRRFIALIQAIEPDTFSELVRDCRQLAVAIERPNRRPDQRGRRSPLAES
jgi:hypothetical protein